MKKIIAIQGSYRSGGKTTTMLKYAVEKTKAQNIEVTYINLHEKNIEYCKGCRKCFDSAECVFKIKTYLTECRGPLWRKQILFQSQDLKEKGICFLLRVIHLCHLQNGVAKLADL